MPTPLIGLLGIALGIVVLFVLICIPHNLRVKRVRRAYRSLPNDVINEVLDLIEQAAAKGPSVTLLRPAEEVTCAGAVLVQSRIGGEPYCESSDIPSVNVVDSELPDFLLQVRLDHSDFGDQWRRLLVAFLVFDAEQVVRSYMEPSTAKHVSYSATRKRRPCLRLRSLRMPASVDEEGTFPILSQQLCRDFPEVTLPLRPYTKDFAGVLTQILCPNVYGYSLDTPDIAYIGGDPMLIQGPHDPVCDECGRPMRFLFQFGENVVGVPMGDAGVYYVYGCDEHPERCRGFVDSH